MDLPREILKQCVEHLKPFHAFSRLAACSKELHATLTTWADEDKRFCHGVFADSFLLSWSRKLKRGEAVCVPDSLNKAILEEICRRVGVSARCRVDASKTYTTDSHTEVEFACFPLCYANLYRRTLELSSVEDLTYDLIQSYETFFVRDRDLVQPVCSLLMQFSERRKRLILQADSFTIPVPARLYHQHIKRFGKVHGVQGYLRGRTYADLCFLANPVYSQTALKWLEEISPISVGERPLTGALLLAPDASFAEKVREAPRPTKEEMKIVEPYYLVKCSLTVSKGDKHSLFHAEAKEMCKSYGLPVSGTRAALLERLLTYLS